jgi:hypothetical protein
MTSEGEMKTDDMAEASAPQAEAMEPAAALERAATPLAAEWRPDVCIYHRSCTDGFAAAWAVHRRWGDAVQYIPMSYGDPVPDIAGKHVLMVDFSLKRDAMIEAAKVAKSIVVLDHHESAEADLADFACPLCNTKGVPVPTLQDVVSHLSSPTNVTPRDRVVAGFDMAKSGCRLAWEFCHPWEIMPALLAFIEDRDLWVYRFGMETKAVAAAVRAYEFTFERFDSWVAEGALSALITEGMPVARAHEKTVSELVSHAYMTEVAGHTVPVANVPYMFASDVGHALLKRYPDAPFAATWTRSGHGKILWSLRSEEGRLNVAEIAASKGGGGHRNAAGFSTPIAIGTP